MDSHYRNTNHVRHDRSGAVLAVALICLLVITALGGLLLRALIAERRQSERQRYETQALWIAESAVQRAMSQLASNPDYAGETWRLETEQNGANAPGSAVIQLRSTADDRTQVRILVEVQYPTDAVYRVRQDRDILIPNPSSGDTL
jgi:Tfp pilus assembly protein PilX